MLDDLVVRVVADTGEMGYGEAPPTAVTTGDTKGSVAAPSRELSSVPTSSAWMWKI